MAKGDSSGDEVDEGKPKEDFNSMAERLRLRSGKKPSYVEEDAGEDDMDWESDEVGKMDDKQTQAKKKKQRAESCSVCNSGERLNFCSTCSAAYHIGCLNPPLKVAPRGKWSCPQCVDPLADIDKFLDCQMRSPTISGANVEDEAAAGTSSESPKRHYLVKWKSRSFLHCTWVLEAELEKVAKNYSGLKIKLNNFRRQMESSKSWNMLEDDLAPIRPEWTTVEKILDFRQTGGVKEYLVKWKELGYEDLSWEVEEDIVSFQDQIEKFNTMKSRASKSSSKKRKGSTIESREGKKRPKDFKAYEETPKFLSGGVLHRYQLEGLNFLRFAWRQGKHVILADEMGLGKTIQSISFLASLLEEGVLVPHLVVAPLSTLRNWEREFATWAPQMNTVMYVGSAQARAVIREYEFYFPKEKVAQKKKRLQKKQVTAKQNKQDRIKFNVLLTSYEMINLDTTILKSLKWECLIVDEGHRLKNKDSKLFQTLRQYSTRHRVLLTGTPLQNNLDELFMLMHFLDAGKFASLEEFQEEFRDINQEEQVGRLHKMLAPHLLRRVKKDVMKDLPPKKELILRVELSSLQKEYYKAILTRNYQLLSRRGGPQISLNNVAMELRKLCGHPYLLEGVEPTVRKASEAYRQLLEASGKLLLMDKMMVKLKDRGHRVLIYSQFKIMLDILEDWLSYKKWSYERIDGSVSGTERQVRIDRFNAPNSTRFCFLLSTRAGGLGINLATADTVIIYDSDWNPHADLQAMARAHRLGQTNKVMIYRLVTRGSIEERMMQMTKKKMVLEHLVVGRMKTQQVLNQEELDDILRYGAKELFAEENDETKKSQQIHYDEAAIDRLLDRSQVENEDAGADEEDNDFLKAFKVANFEYVDEEEAAAARAKLAAEAEADKEGDKISSADREKYWEDLLKQRFEEQKYESFVELGKGKRARKQVVPLAEDDLAGMANISSDDDDDEREPEPVVAEVSNTAKEANEPVGKKSQVSRKKPRVEHTEPAGPPPLLAGEGKSLRILGFNRRQRAMFVQILMRFGIGDFSWSEFIPRLKPKTSEEIKDYGTLFLTHIAEDISDSPTFSDGVPKEGLRIQDVLVRLAILHLMQDKVNNFTEEPAAPLFSDEVHKRLPALMNTKVWKEPHDRKLLQAILKHGYGRWQEIMDDTELNFQSVISKELQLPSTSGGGSGQDDANIPTYQPGQGETSLPSENVQGGLPVSDSFQGAVHGEPVGVPSAGNVVQSTQEDLTVVVMSSKDTQQQSSHKRMVEFIKRRAMLLEKALNAEYHQETTSEQRGDEDVDDDYLTMGMQGPEIDTQVQHGRSQSPVPTPLAPEEIVACAFDSESRRLEVARIYNEMCKLVNESEADAAETYSGNKAAGVRLRRSSRQMDGLCVEMRKSLVAMHSPESTHERNHGGNNNFGMNGGAGAAVMGEDVDAQSDDRDEDAEPELDSDGDMPATPFGQRKSGVHGSSERHKTQETTAVYTTDVNSNCKTDNLTSGKNNVICGRQFSNPQNNSTSWASVVVLDD